MPVQICNTYGFNVKRKSIQNSPISIDPKNPYQAAAGTAAYSGDQVYVVASSLANALAVLQAQYGTDLGTVTGGTTHVFGALTTMSGT